MREGLWLRGRLRVRVRSLGSIRVRASYRAMARARAYTDANLHSVALAGPKGYWY